MPLKFSVFFQDFQLLFWFFDLYTMVCCYPHNFTMSELGIHNNNNRVRAYWMRKIEGQTFLKFQTKFLTAIFNCYSIGFSVFVRQEYRSFVDDNSGRYPCIFTIKRSWDRQIKSSAESVSNTALIPRLLRVPHSFSIIKIRD